MVNSVVFSKSDNADIRRVVYVPKYDAEVEYLQSSGTQWIDTGIIPNSEHKYEVTVSKTADNTAEVVPLGSWNAWQNAMFGSDIKNSTVGIYLLWGGGNHQTNIITNDWITLYGEKGLSKATLISTGEILAARQFSATFTCNQSAYLFALNRNGSVAYRGSCKISRAKIWNGDTLVRDFIPVRVGSVGYMYDKVSGQLFGNAGTGNFVLGQDVAKPIVKRYVVPSGLEEGVDYEFVNAFLLTNYNLVRIEPNYPVIFKVKPIEGIQNVVVNSGQSVFFIQNYTSSYKRWQAWNYDTPVTYDIPINGINTFTLNANKFIINSSEHSYPSHWNFQVQLVFNTRRINGTGSIVFYSIKSESMDLRPIRLLRNISGKHTFDRQPKTIGSLGLLDISNQILYFGSGENISVYND